MEFPNLYSKISKIERLDGPSTIERFAVLKYAQMICVSTQKSLNLWRLPSSTTFQNQTLDIDADSGFKLLKPSDSAPTSTKVGVSALHGTRLVSTATDEVWTIPNNSYRLTPVRSWKIFSRIIHLSDISDCNIVMGMDPSHIYFWDITNGECVLTMDFPQTDQYRCFQIFAVGSDSISLRTSGSLRDSTSSLTTSQELRASATLRISSNNIKSSGSYIATSTRIIAMGYHRDIKLFKLIVHTKHPSNIIDSVEFVPAETLKGHVQTVAAMLFVDGRLWTSAGERIILFEQDDMDEWKAVHRSTIPLSGTIGSLFLWNEYVVGRSGERTVSFWLRNGEFSHFYTTESSYIDSIVWLDRLCTFPDGSLFTDDDKMRIIDKTNKVLLRMERMNDCYVFVWNNELFCMDFYGHVTSHKGTPNLYEINIAVTYRWSVIRLLWMGNMKNDPKDCHLAKLPRELLRVIIDCIEADPFVYVELPEEAEPTPGHYYSKLYETLMTHYCAIV